MFFVCGIWCVARVSNVSPSSEREMGGNMNIVRNCANLRVCSEPWLPNYCFGQKC